MDKLKIITTFVLCLTNNVFGFVVVDHNGVAFYDFIEGYENYKVDADNSTAILGDGTDESKVVYRFYLPPEVGSHKIEYLRITVQGSGTIDEIKFGGPTTIFYTDVTDTTTFVFPNPEHPTIGISDLLESTGDSFSGRYLRIKISVTKSLSKYKLQKIILEYNYSGVSDEIVKHFMASYGAYLNIKHSSEMIYERWDSDEITEKMFVLGITHTLTFMASSAFNEVASGLLSWASSKIFGILGILDIIDLESDAFWFRTVSQGDHEQESINTACIDAYQACESLAFLWKQGFDNMDAANLIAKISNLKPKLNTLESRLNTAVSVTDELPSLYNIYKERWIDPGDGTEGSSHKGDFMAEIMIKSFAPFIMYDFSETQPPTARSDSFITKFKNVLSAQENFIQRNYFKVTAQAGAHGVVNPSGTIYVKAGDSITFYATPDASYSVDKWYIDGQPDAATVGLNSLTLDNVQEETTVQVTFRISELIVERPATNPYRTGDSSVMCNGTAPLNTHKVLWENTTTGDNGDTGDLLGTTWVERIPVDEGSNIIIFRAYDISNNFLASASIEVIRVNNIKEGNGSNQQSCWISSGHPKKTFGGIVFVGCDPTDGYYNERGLVTFDLPSLPPGSTVTNATFSAKTTSGDNTGDGTMGLTVRRITSSWSTDSVTWNTKPNNTTSGQTTEYLEKLDNHFFYWDVTAIAQSWYGGSNNYGLFMISQSEDINYNLERVFYKNEFGLKIKYSVETEVPQIQITSPTSEPSYTTGASSVSLAGAASDNYQVSRVDYLNQTTGASGTASGTNPWSCTVPLTAGLNTISVIAYDASDNSDSDTITVIYLTPPATVSATDDIVDHVLVQWDPVTDAGYYRVYRSESETGAKVAISAWIDALSFMDTPAVLGDSYYYWVAASADSSGVGQSDYAGPAIGKRRAPDTNLNKDWTVDFFDLAVLASRWFEEDCFGPGWCEGADIDWSGQVDFVDLHIIAENWLQGEAIPSDMVLVPGGEFQMGDSFNEGEPDERPQHLVRLDSFYMGRYEVTNGQYCQYLNSALGSSIYVSGDVVYGSGNNQPYCDTSTSSSYSQIEYDLGPRGYIFRVRPKGGRNMDNDPMVRVSWYGAAAYCNWRSQQEGREQCYNLSTWACDFSKKGYRLPTEAEWEYAARGGHHDPYYRYPWGDTISQSQANYGYHPLWNDGIYPYTSPVGFFDGTMKYKADYQWPGSATSYQTTSGVNNYGLYDMAGNVWEWGNDWYGAYSSNAQTNPTGPSSDSYRVLRGGGWSYNAYNCRVARRGEDVPDGRNDSGLDGFRVVLDLN